ncbi:Leucine aminopeptidase-related protein, partial [hydrothermal vent metagenome]
SEYTLENVVIDNYFFGVASVAKDGAESPVVFPGPAGSFGE